MSIAGHNVSKSDLKHLKSAANIAFKLARGGNPAFAVASVAAEQGLKAYGFNVDGDEDDETREYNNRKRERNNARVRAAAQEVASGAQNAANVVASGAQTAILKIKEIKIPPPNINIPAPPPIRVPQISIPRINPPKISLPRVSTPRIRWR
jgi:hypothetical protein